MVAMTNGSGLHIYGSIGLSGRLWISDNAIQRMEFLNRHDCSVACDKELLVMGGDTIQYTDRMGCLPARKVQVAKTLMLPPDRKVHIRNGLNSEPSRPVGLIEGLLNREIAVAVAVTLDTPRIRRDVTVRCMNPGTEPQELKAGTVIGIYHPVKDDQIEKVDV